VKGNLPQHTLHFASLLVAIADVYDALRTVRPYRPALSVAKTATILIKDTLAGKLHREYVSKFLLLLNVLAPGRRVILSDGSSGMIVEVRDGGFGIFPSLQPPRFRRSKKNQPGAFKMPAAKRPTPSLRLRA
ncbi:MAG: hypothetical protein H6Q41_2545, partial [Deltaproteobacteria bacterium]|nr:hypothetical protein [Deltaproteobacteria bacterium]